MILPIGQNSLSELPSHIHCGICGILLNASGPNCVPVIVVTPNGVHTDTLVPRTSESYSIDLSKVGSGSYATLKQYGTIRKEGASWTFSTSQSPACRTEATPGTAYTEAITEVWKNNTKLPSSEYTVSGSTLTVHAPGVYYVNCTPKQPQIITLTQTYSKTYNQTSFNLDTDVSCM